ncbi:MAG TPA: serine hydrolase domain-containing protein [Vicinamibacterales bacterium]|nr:serine hydrolase domain-containing protein [Vicinamibacterales bacterium]
MTGSFSTSDAARVIEDAIAAGLLPAAAVDVGSSDGPMWSQAFGAVTFVDGRVAASVETPFDLASLTKVIATTTIAMNLVANGVLRLDQPVAELLREWRGADRAAVTIADLLVHASGLPARLVDTPPAGRREFEHDICTMPLEYLPRTASIYSDLGFILLGFLLADRGGSPLQDQFDALKVWPTASAKALADRRFDFATAASNPPERGSEDGSVDSHLLTFDLPLARRRLTAPTMPMADDARRGRVLRGEVHDNYAAALGGVAGHAGLFGTAPGVGAFARQVLRALRGDMTLPPPWKPERLRRFAAKTSVPGSSRALGWDTMLPTSSCGTRMSASAIGHVGFTGTSLWIDPDRDRYFVLLTNRVCGAGTLDQMRSVRRAFHDALAP